MGCPDFELSTESAGKVGESSPDETVCVHFIACGSTGLLSWNGDTVLDHVFKGAASRFLSLDVSGLKDLNKALGIPVSKDKTDFRVADEVLTQISRAIRKSGGERYYAARLHGDEFKIRLVNDGVPAIADPDEVLNKFVSGDVDNLLHGLAFERQIDGRTVTLKGAAVQRGFGPTFEKADGNIESQNKDRGGKPSYSAVSRDETSSETSVLKTGKLNEDNLPDMAIVIRIGGAKSGNIVRVSVKDILSTIAWEPPHEDVDRSGNGVSQEQLSVAVSHDSRDGQGISQGRVPDGEQEQSLPEGHPGAVLSADEGRASPDGRQAP